MGVLLAHGAYLALGEEIAAPPVNLASLFDWDLVSLEQNNPRFNASVLSGFHSVRSAGTTPDRAWKTGIGILYTREKLVAEADSTELFAKEQLILNPKINHGFLGVFEAGVGLEASYATGEEVGTAPDGSTTIDPASDVGLSAVDVGIKWGFLELGRLRLALSLDTRIAVNRDEFGMLPITLYNAEVDADFAITPRFGLLSNVQFMTTDRFLEENQFVFDLGTTYAFSDRFRGLVFGTLQVEEEFENVLVFVGLAGQYVFEQHSFTLALDFQINEAARDVRTEKQLDLELSYTFTF